MTKKFTSETTDTGTYYYENGSRIYPEDFWNIIQNQEKKIHELEAQSIIRQDVINAMKGNFHSRESRRFQVIHDRGTPEIYNSILGLIYKPEEVADALNHSTNFSDIVFSLIQNKMWYLQSKKHDLPEKERSYEHNPYYQYDIEEQALRELREELYDSRKSLTFYENYLNKKFLEQQKRKGV